MFLCVRSVEPSLVAAAPPTVGVQVSRGVKKGRQRERDVVKTSEGLFNLEHPKRQKRETEQLFQTVLNIF